MLEEKNQMTSVLEHFDIVHTNYGCYLNRV